MTVLKLNSTQGTVAFVLFPVPTSDLRWNRYFERVAEETGTSMDRETNCRIIEMKVDEVKKCDVMYARLSHGPKSTSGFFIILSFRSIFLLR